MGIDIRLPIGLLFTLLGLLLFGYGLASDPVIYERSLGVNLNVGWGAVMATFGILMLALARRSRARLAAGREQPSARSPD